MAPGKDGSSAFAEDDGKGGICPLWVNLKGRWYKVRNSKSLTVAVSGPAEWQDV